MDEAALGQVTMLAEKVHRRSSLLWSESPAPAASLWSLAPQALLNTEDTLLCFRSHWAEENVGSCSVPWQAPEPEEPGEVGRGQLWDGVVAGVLPSAPGIQAEDALGLSA